MYPYNNVQPDDVTRLADSIGSDSVSKDNTLISVWERSAEVRVDWKREKPVLAEWEQLHSSIIRAKHHYNDKSLVDLESNEDYYPDPQPKNTLDYDYAA